MLTLLIIDRDAAGRRTLGDQLSREGRWTIVLAPSLEDCLDQKADLALFSLDASDDRTALSLWMSTRPEVAVIALIPGDAEPVAQAATTLSKPVRITDLVEALGRVEAANAIPGAMGPLRLDRRAKLLRLEGAELRLTEKEVAILDCLIAAGDATVSRDRLLGEVWGYSPDATTHTVETHIYRLRRKLEAELALGDFLVTDSGGYRLKIPS